MDIKDYIKQGYDKNILVFDSQDKKGEITPRLKDLMKEMMQNYYHCKIDVFFHKDSTDDWNEIEKYYTDELQGCYAKDDKNLVVGLCTKNNNVILGSF